MLHADLGNIDSGFMLNQGLEMVGLVQIALLHLLDHFEVLTLELPL